MHCCTSSFCYQFCLLSWQIERALNIDRLTLTKQMEFAVVEILSYKQRQKCFVQLFTGTENSDKIESVRKEKRLHGATQGTRVYTGVCSESAAFHIR